jgi:hypothetical protein
VPEWPSQRELRAWAHETVAHSRAIVADSARLRRSVRATRAESERLREQSLARRAAELRPR